jgi:hypothetical protein
MLIIRKEQMAVFSRAELEEFGDRMVKHLNKCFSEECKSLGEPEVRKLIQYGVGRAASYGITVERDVCKYIDLMMAFGVDFDQSTHHSWASNVLNHPKLKNPTRKMNRLFQVAKRHC